MKYSKVTQLEDIQLSSKVVVSDPCYGRDTWCMGFLDITPGTYETKLFYSDEGSWGTRVAKLGIYRKGSEEAVMEEDSGISVGVDSGQAGIFDDSVYPASKAEQGDYGDENSFYGKVCELTLGEGYNALERRAYYSSNIREFEEKIKNFPMNPRVEEWKDQIRYFQERHDSIADVPYHQGGTLEGKGVVSSSGYGDGGYSCIVGKTASGETAYVEIIFIDDFDEADADIDEEVLEKERTVKESGTL